MNLPPTNHDSTGREGPDYGREELGILLEAVCEDRLTAAEHARLEHLLLTDSAARAYYLNYIDLHGALYWDLAVAEQGEDDAVAALVDATILRLARPEVELPTPEHSRKHATFTRRLTQSFKKLTFVPLTSRTWLRRASLVAAGCVVLGLGVWIGNRTAKPGQLALTMPKDTQTSGENEASAGGTSSSRLLDGDSNHELKGTDLAHSTVPNPTASNSTVSNPSYVKDGAGRRKFGSDDVQLATVSPTQPVTPATNAAAATEIPAVESPAVNHSVANQSAGPANSETKNKPQLASTAGTSASSSGTVIAYIGEQLKAGWSSAGLNPSAKADDAEWLRRVHLDLSGHIPPVADVERFLANRSSSKRAIEIDRLLDSPAFARNFATIWTNLLVGRAPREEVNRPALATFLRQKFAYNRSWQEVVFDLVAAEGRTDQNGAANFLVAHLNGGAIPATGITSRLFLGAQLQCAQCHNHPFSNSKQEQFWAFNSFFQQAVVVRVPQYDTKTGQMVVAGIELATRDVDEPRYYETRTGVMKVAYPAFGGTKIDTTQVTNRRRELARLMTSSEDSSFAPAFVNRMWAHFHGRSFTPVVDDMGSHVAPSHPQLLDRLSEEFVRSGYDIKQLIRWICNSDGYQLTSRFGEQNSKDDPERGEPPLFSHMYVKPMSPEQLYDSMVVATQGQLAGGPTLDQSDKTRDAWLRQFVVSFETEENDETSTLNGSITQSLLMMNGDLVRGATEVQSGTWLHKLLVSKANETERVQALFVSALSRPATAKELAMVKKLLKNSLALGKSVSLEQAYQDVYWALLNSNEFILNH
ncbi:MAG: hypothetical protein JWM11_7814 [Planctomycetaceae bacterium]|nr:hypothetical protein [Planctomycetaceae bacterium]